MKLFFFQKKQEGGKDFRVVLVDNITGGRTEEFVKAGCAEEAEQRAIEHMSDRVDPDNLQVVSVEQGDIVWQ